MAQQPTHSRLHYHLRYHYQTVGEMIHKIFTPINSKVAYNYTNTSYIAQLNKSQQLYFYSTARFYKKNLTWYGTAILRPSILVSMIMEHRWNIAGSGVGRVGESGVDESSSDPTRAINRSEGQQSESSLGLSPGAGGPEKDRLSCPWTTMEPSSIRNVSIIDCT